MSSQSPQSWQNCDKDVKDFVLGLVAKLESELNGNLVGIYLHGSLAMGGYYRPKSDIDLIVVVRDRLNPSERKSVSEMIAKHSLLKPTTGNVELSIILAETAKEIPVPVPFEVHYSTGWHDKILSGDIDYAKDRFDTDLQAHLAYVIQRGVVLMGKPVSEVFGNIDWHVFMEGVIDDFNWIVDGDNIAETPFYGVLNICRVLNYLPRITSRYTVKTRVVNGHLQTCRSSTAQLLNRHWVPIVLVNKLKVIGTFVLVLAPRFGYRDTTQPAVFGALHSYLGAA